jgi:NAD(P)-dependent dehydrogenase (short-subunit alcohol dehydrogenase family)
MSAATARLLAREDAKVVIADMLEHDGRHVAESIGDTAHFERLDVTDEANWEAVVDAAVARFGMLNVLMNKRRYLRQRRTGFLRHRRLTSDYGG